MPEKLRKRGHGSWTLQLELLRLEMAQQLWKKAPKCSGGTITDPNTSLRDF